MASFRLSGPPKRSIVASEYSLTAACAATCVLDTYVKASAPAYLHDQVCTHEHVRYMAASGAVHVSQCNAQQALLQFAISGRSGCGADAYDMLRWRC